MNARTPAIAVPLLMLASLVVASGPAAAIYVITPLTMTASQSEAEVGDEIVFDLAPNPDHEGESYAGATARVQYGFDTMEGQHQPSEDPDAPVSSENGTTSSDESPREESTYVYRDVATITLDDESRASFRWVVPEEVDDRNVFVTVLTEEGNTLASAHVRVGDAEPMMFATGGGAEGAPASDRVGEPLPEGGADPAATTGTGDGEGSGDGAPAQDDAQDGGNAVPGLGILAALGVLGLAALALRRRG